jgi:hypothetical protein
MHAAFFAKPRAGLALQMALGVLGGTIARVDD